MSDQVSNQPPDHEPEAQPAADEPQADHPADDSKAEASEPEPETPKPRWGFWRRRREQRGRAESRFSILTALISAGAALRGAAVGGIASYEAAQSQAAAQFRVAESNNTAQANQALIARRQIAYSDLLAAEEDLEVAQFRLGDAIQDFKPPNVEPVQEAFKREDDAHTKWLHACDTVALVDSPQVESSLEALSNHQTELSTEVGNLANVTIYQKQTDPDALSRFVQKVKDLGALVSALLGAAKSDISG
jgi:hypothetical protein